MLAVERLEDRTVPATFMVNTTLDILGHDNGLLSLRQAILDADASASPNTIAFAIPTTDAGYDSISGAFTIYPTSALPAINPSFDNVPLAIDGTTQPGYAGAPLIALNGDEAGVTDGLVCSGGNRGGFDTLKALAINSFAGSGIVLTSINNTVSGCFIGTDVTGTHRLGNQNDGIRVFGGFGNTIGGTAAGQGNVISGNYNAGIELFGPGNLVAGNLIGLAAGGNILLPNTGQGVWVRADNNVIGGLTASARNVISTNGNGILVQPSNGAVQGVVIQGNYIGTTAAGTTALGNLGDGVYLTSGAIGTLVGGSAPGAGNLISGNIRNGITLTASCGDNTVIAGNRIGTDVTGMVGLGNGAVGVYIQCSNTTVGGTATGAGNLISANGGNGVWIDGAEPLPTNGNLVQGNLIGTDASGHPVLGNGGDGVQIRFGGYVVVYNNQIGGSTAGAGNVIAGNLGNGVAVLGPDALGNRIQGNSIYANSLKGIDLEGGANNQQSFPVISGATGGAATHVLGTLNSLASTTFTVDFYANAAPAASGYGQGQRYLGHASVATSSSGNASFDVMVGTSYFGEWITATATDEPAGDTSQFSKAVLVQNSVVASAGGPYTMNYGGPLTLDASASTGPAGDALTYSWTINGQANAASGVQPTLSWSQLQALGVTAQPFSAGVRVADGFGFGSTASTTVTVRIPTAVALNSSAVNNTSVFGQPVTFTATVTGTPGSGTPTGTVVFKDGTSTVGTGSLDNAGRATLTTAALSAGTHSLTASYLGDSTRISSDSTVLTQTVQQAATTTSVTSNQNPSTFGQPVLLTATVTGSGTPDGTVTFFSSKNGSTPLGTATLVQGQASLLLSTLPAGLQNISADYAGNNNYLTSKTTDHPENVYLQLVHPAGYTTVQPTTATTTYSTSAQTVTLVGNVSSYPGPVNGGTISFFIGGGGGFFGVVSSTVSQGTASVTFTLPARTAAQTFTILTSYSGNGPFLGSSDSTGTLTVNKATPVVAWSNPADITYGTKLGGTQLNATASVAGTFAYTPAAGTVLNAGNTETLTVTFTPKDTTDYNSLSKSVAINVLPATLTVITANKSKTYGDAFAAFTGSLRGLKNGDNITANFSSAGAAATATVAGGPYAISATLSDPSSKLGNYTVLTNYGALTVNKARLTITADDASKIYGQTWTFAGTEFTSSGLKNSDTVTNVTLTSKGTAALATVAGSPYSIVASAAVGTGLANYTISYKVGHLTVTKRDTAFRNLSSPGITHGNNNSATISGHVGAGTTNATGSVALTITGNGVNLTRTVGLDANGNFAPVFTRNWAIGNYTVNYHYAGSANFNAIIPDGSTLLTINPPISLGSLSVTQGTANQLYGGGITFTGGTAPFSLVVTNLPPAIVAPSGNQYYQSTLSATLFDFNTIEISGTPIKSGTNAIGVSLRDSTGATATGVYSLMIYPANSLTLLPTSLPTAPTGQAYSATVSAAATGGSGQYICTLTAGALPPGLTLGSDGVVSGTTTVAGTFDFTVMVSDTSISGLTGSGDFTLTVAAGALPTATLTSVTSARPFTNSTSLTLGFAVSEPATIEFSLDSRAFAACASPLQLTGLSDGPHRVTLRLTDLAGDVVNVDLYDWLVDTVPPKLTFISATPGWSPTIYPSATFQFVTNSDAVTIGQLDNNAPVPISSPWTVNGLANGPHHVTITASDAAGNLSVPITYAWVVESTFFVSNVGLQLVSASSVLVTWNTNIPSTSQVQFGQGNFAMVTPLDPTLTLTHSVQINGLVSGAAYLAQAVSTSPDGRLTISDPVPFQMP